MLALSTFPLLVSGSAERPFLLDTREEAEERAWVLCRDLALSPLDVLTKGSIGTRATQEVGRMHACVSGRAVVPRRARIELQRPRMTLGSEAAVILSSEKLKRVSTSMWWRRAAEHHPRRHCWLGKHAFSFDDCHGRGRSSSGQAPEARQGRRQSRSSTSRQAIENIRAV